MKSTTLLVLIITFFLLNNSFTSSAQSQYAKNAVNVAVFVYQGVETLDFAGPGEVFSDAYNDSGKLCHVYTVAATKDEIVSQGFLRVNPDYSIYDCPKPDIIVIPGGNTQIPMEDEKVVNWLKKYSTTNTHYLSVCTGAFLLAKTGLLNGKTATTHFCCQDELAKDFTEVHVVKHTRFVDNGSTITTEGISAGIDGSLYQLEKLFGHAVALNVSKYMMYDWRPDEMNKVVNQ